MPANWKKDFHGHLVEMRGEFSARRAAILSQQGRSFMERAAMVIARGVGGSDSDWVAGGDLARLAPGKHADQMKGLLRQNPMDQEIRMELVGRAAKSNRELPLDAWRVLTLQACAAQSFNRHTTKGLQLALWVQNQYLRRLERTVRFEAESLAMKLNTRESNAFQQQANMIGRELEQFNRTLEQIRGVAALMERATAGGQTRLDTALDVRDIETYRDKPDALDKETVRKLFFRANIALHYLRGLPLLHPTALRMAEGLTCLEPNNPLGYFFQGRLHRVQLQLAVELLRHGHADESLREEARERFKAAYRQLGLAAQRASAGGGKGSDVTILWEYGALVRDFPRMARGAMRLSLPEEWTGSMLDKARKLLSRAACGEPKLANLIREIEMEMRRQAPVHE